MKRVGIGPRLAECCFEPLGPRCLLSLSSNLAIHVLYNNFKRNATAETTSRQNYPLCFDFTLLGLALQQGFHVRSVTFSLIMKTGLPFNRKKISMHVIIVPRRSLVAVLRVVFSRE